MTALKIISVILGLAFTLFGYFIFFRKNTVLSTDLKKIIRTD